MTGAADTVRHSCVYFGRVRHRRFDAVRHDFGVRLFFVYLDLDELDAAFAGRWFWSARRMAPLRFRRSDYFGDPRTPLAEAVRDAVARKLGQRPTGPVRMLTNLRCLGWSFNPVTIYYCFDDAGAVAAVLAEITNTPWGERHHYVVGAAADGPRLRAAMRKEFHVSPFQPMAQDYEWAFSPPGERLAVHMQNRVGGARVFDATLGLTRAPWRGRTLARALLRHPWMSAKVSLMIYWHALRLWLKRAPFFDHPPRTTTP